MTDQIGENPDGKIVLNANGQRVIASGTDPACCFPVNYGCSSCCWGDTLTLTFDTFSEVYGGGDPLIEAALDWMVANFSSQTIDAIKYTPDFASNSICTQTGWLYNGTIFYVSGGGTAYYMQIWIKSGPIQIYCFAPYTFVVAYIAAPGPGWTVGDPVPLPATFPTTRPLTSFVVGTASGIGQGFAECGVPDTNVTDGDCCEGQWGDDAIYLWDPSTISASTGINGIVTFTANSDDEVCTRTCEESETCYQIAGYVDGDLLPCATCWTDGATAWDGTFENFGSPVGCDPPSDDTPCVWYSTAPGAGDRTISGKLLDWRNSIIIRQCGWVLQICCNRADSSTDMQTCIIWSGYKATGSTPDGVYTRLCGTDTTATITIEACP